MKKKIKAEQVVKQAEPFCFALWLLAAAWFLPFLVSYHALPIADFYTEWIAFGLGLAAMYRLAQSESWPRGFELPRIVLLPVGLGLVLLLQMLLGRVAYGETVLMAELYLLWMMALICLGHVLKQQFGLERIAVPLSWAIVSGGLISSLIGLLQYLQWQAPFASLIAPHVSGAVYGNLGQANHFANYLSIALVGVAYLLMTRRIGLQWAVAATVFLLLGMTLSSSRTTWIYLLFFALIAYGIYWRSNEESTKLLRKAVLLVVPVYAAIQFAVMHLPHTGSVLVTVDRITKANYIIEARWFFWQQAWQMFLHSPWLGAGWGEFTWQLFLHFSDKHELGEANLDPNAHNFVMHLLATTGLSGVLLVLIPLGAWLWRVRSLPVTPEKWWLICILGVQLIHGLLEYNLWYAQFLGIAALLLGLGESGVLRLSMGVKIRPHWLWLPVLLLGVLQWVAVLQDYRSIEGWVFNGQNFNAQDPVGSANKMREELRSLEARSLLRPLVELTHPELVVPASAAMNEKLALDTRVMHYAPNSEVVYRHAMMLAANGEQQEAKTQLERAIAVYPGDLELFVKRISVLEQSQPRLFGEISRWAQEKLHAASATKTQ